MGNSAVSKLAPYDDGEQTIRTVAEAIEEPRTPSTTASATTVDAQTTLPSHSAGLKDVAGVPNGPQRQASSSGATEVLDNLASSTNNRTCPANETCDVKDGACDTTDGPCKAAEDEGDATTAPCSPVSLAPTTPATSSAASSPDRTLLVPRGATSFTAAARSPTSSPAPLPSVVGPASSEIPSTAGLAAQIANACIAAAMAKLLATHTPTIARKEISDVDSRTGAPPASAAGHIEGEDTKPPTRDVALPPSSTLPSADVATTHEAPTVASVSSGHATVNRLSSKKARGRKNKAQRSASWMTKDAVASVAGDIEEARSAASLAGTDDQERGCVLSLTDSIQTIIQGLVSSGHQSKSVRLPLEAYDELIASKTFLGQQVEALRVMRKHLHRCLVKAEARGEVLSKRLHKAKQDGHFQQKLCREEKERVSVLRWNLHAQERRAHDRLKSLQRLMRKYDRTTLRQQGLQQEVQALEVEKAGLEVQLRAAQHKATETQQRAAELSLERDAALIARENLEQELFKTQSGNALLTDRVKSLNVIRSELLRQSNDATAQLLGYKRDVDELSAKTSERETQLGAALGHANRVRELEIELAVANEELQQERDARALLEAQHSELEEMAAEIDALNKREIQQLADQLRDAQDKNTAQAAEISRLSAELRKSQTAVSGAGLVSIAGGSLADSQASSSSGTSTASALSALASSPFGFGCGFGFAPTPTLLPPGVAAPESEVGHLTAQLQVAQQKLQAAERQIQACTAQRLAAQQATAASQAQVDSCVEFFITLDGYYMTKLLGQGGQGMVLLGEQDGRKEAIKIFTDPSGLKRELDNLNALRHTGFVPLVRRAVQLPNVGGLLIMEYIEGMTLDVAAMQPWFTWGVVDQIVAQGHLYFQAANALGVVHHDIRPENIMVTVNDTIDGAVPVVKVKMIDLGMGERVGGLLKAVGTPEYSPLEELLAGLQERMNKQAGTVIQPLPLLDISVDLASFAYSVDLIVSMSSLFNHKHRIKRLVECHQAVRFHLYGHGAATELVELSTLEGVRSALVTYYTRHIAAMKRRVNNWAYDGKLALGTATLLTRWLSADPAARMVGFDASIDSIFEYDEAFMAAWGASQQSGTVVGAEPEEAVGHPLLAGLPPPLT